MIGRHPTAGSAWTTCSIQMIGTPFLWMILIVSIWLTHSASVSPSAVSSRIGSFGRAQSARAGSSHFRFRSVSDPIQFSSLRIRLRT